MNKNVQELSSLENLDIIAEIVFDPYLEPEIQFATFDKSTQKIDYLHELTFQDGNIVVPLQSNLIKEGKILLPSSAEWYQDEATLLSEIEFFIYKYLDLPHPFYLKLVSHYILLTWVFDKLSVVPYLRALGDYGSGKTRFAQVIGSLCYKPLFMAGATSDSFIFRMIEIFKGTLILNELERVNTDLQSQLTVILNNGYERGLFVGRVEGEKKREPKVFDVFSPKIITSRSPFKDLALESRILSIPMRPTKRTDIPPLLDILFWRRAQEIRNKLLMYRFKNLNNPDLEDKSYLLKEVEPRLRQTLLPLLYVIDDKEVEGELVSFAVQFQEYIYSERSFETEALVAEKLIDLLKNNKHVNVSEVTESVNKELGDKEQLTNKAIGKKIRGFGFKTKKVQGLFQIVYNQPTIDYLKDRFNLEASKQSLPNPLSLPMDSESEVDLVDKVDLPKTIEQLSLDEQLALGKEIFGEGTRWSREDSDENSE